MCRLYWIACVETHPSPNSIIIQLNKSSVRDRSFSRKLKVSGLSFYPKVIQGIFIPSFIFWFWKGAIVWRRFEMYLSTNCMISEIIPLRLRKTWNCVNWWGVLKRKVCLFHFWWGQILTGMGMRLYPGTEERKLPYGQVRQRCLLL